LDITNIESALEMKEIIIYSQGYVKEKEIENNEKIIN